MFHWLLSKFRSNERYDTYHPGERLIYRYWDGGKFITADPLVVYKRMMTKGPELSVDIKVARSASKDAAKANDRMIEKIREIFAVKPLDQGGLAEVETVELMDHFLVYCQQVKKNSRPSATSSTPTVDSTFSSNGSPTTSNSSASGSIVGESDSAVPTPSPPESEPLLASPIPDSNTTSP